MDEIYTYPPFQTDWLFSVLSCASNLHPAPNQRRCLHISSLLSATRSLYVTAGAPRVLEWRRTGERPPSPCSIYTYIHMLLWKCSLPHSHLLLPLSDWGRNNQSDPSRLITWVKFLIPRLTFLQHLFIVKCWKKMTLCCNLKWSMYSFYNCVNLLRTPAPLSCLRPCNTKMSHDTGDGGKKRLIGPNLDIFT